MSERRVDRRDVGSWLSGPESVTGREGYPGENLGRPESGPGSIGRPGRRFLGLVIDWVLCLLIARGFAGPEALEPNGSLIPVLVLVIENILLVGTAGATLGQRLVGLRVERVDGSRAGLGAAAIRSVLLGLALPAITLVWNRDYRGLHELAAGTVVTRR
jgi:uncharacterized RDD family membrane protein YckC